MWKAHSLLLLLAIGMNAITASGPRSGMPAHCLRTQLTGLGVHRARSASRASTAQPPKPDLHSAEGLLLACKAVMNEIKAQDSPAFERLVFLHELFYARAANVEAEKGRADEALRRADEALRRADQAKDEAVRRADEAKARADEAKARADAEKARADKVDLEFFAFQARYSSKLETRQLAEQCLDTMGYDSKCTDEDGKKVKHPSATQKVTAFARTLLQPIAKGAGKGRPMLAEQWSKSFVQNTLGMSEAALAKLLHDDLYSSWCEAYHTSREPLVALTGITINEPDSLLGVAKFLFFCKVRSEQTMESIMQGCNIVLQITTTKGPVVYMFDPKSMSVRDMTSALSEVD